MVRGYQKRVIHLKNIGSSLFDEAYFIVNGKEQRDESPSDMIKEANRIIKENLTGKYERGRIIRFVKRFFIPFLAGAVSALLVFIPILCF